MEVKQGNPWLVAGWLAQGFELKDLVPLGSDHLIFMGGGGGGQEDFLKKIIRTVIRTNKIDRMTKQTKKISWTVLKKDGQENVKRQMGTN